MTAAGIAAWASTVTAALLCAGELASSGIVAWHLVFPAMGFIHVLIGLGEAAITAMVLGAIGRARPPLLDAAPTATKGTGEWAVTAAGVIVAIGLVLFVSPFACAWPDGLEKVANDLGFEHRGAADPVFSSPIPDYAIPGMTSSFWATALAGLTGLLATFTLLVLFGLGMTRCRQHDIALAPVTPEQAPRAE